MCVFCEMTKESKIFESHNFYLIYDHNPIQAGHILIVSKRHVMSYLELSHHELLDLQEIQRNLIKVVNHDYNVNDVAFVMNNGKSMDEGVHFHIHVIPRYLDDGLWDTVSVKQQAVNIQKLNERIHHTLGRIS